MQTHPSSPSVGRTLEPHWPAIVNALGIIGLFLALPERLSPGPNWLFPSLIFIALLLAILGHRAGRARMNTAAGLALLVLTTSVEVWALTFLITGLPNKRQPPDELLRSAAVLWISNILIFATWYWRLDAGGPYSRALRESHQEGAFLFPQMMGRTGNSQQNAAWKPGFVDYLFLAFNTSTAFSPTDVPILSRWAKCLMMVQALISLGTIAILVARGINLL